MLPQASAMSMMAIFAVLAFLLATIGVYGVVSYIVSQQTREFGVRLALGASPADLMALVLRRSLTDAVGRDSHRRSCRDRRLAAAWRHPLRRHRDRLANLRRGDWGTARRRDARVLRAGAPSHASRSGCRATRGLTTRPHHTYL